MGLVHGGTKNILGLFERRKAAKPGAVFGVFVQFFWVVLFPKANFHVNQHGIVGQKIGRGGVGIGGVFVVFQHAGNELVELVVIEAHLIFLSREAQGDDSLEQLKLKRQIV